MIRKGFAQIPIMLGLLLMAVAVPVATKLVQQNQTNQGKAANCAGDGEKATSPYIGCCPGLESVNCSTTAGYTTCTCRKKPTNPTATPATRSCKVCVWNSAKTDCGCSNQVVASSKACPASNCTKSDPTAKPTQKDPYCNKQCSCSTCVKTTDGGYCPACPTIKPGTTAVPTIKSGSTCTSGTQPKCVGNLLYTCTAQMTGYVVSGYVWASSDCTVFGSGYTCSGSKCVSPSPFADGHPCTLDIQCKSGECVAAGGSFMTSIYVCGNSSGKLPDNALCGADAECQSGNCFPSAAGRHCLNMGGATVNCNASSGRPNTCQCGSNSQCSSNNCVKSGGDYRCLPSGTYTGNLSACDIHNKTGCDSNHFCMESSGAGLCWPKYGLGTVCSDSGQCTSGLCSVAPGYTRKVCTTSNELYEIGHPCNYDESCKSGHCVNVGGLATNKVCGTVSNLLPDNSVCGADAECQSGNCFPSASGRHCLNMGGGTVNCNASSGRPNTCQCSTNSQCSSNNCVKSGGDYRCLSTGANNGGTLNSCDLRTGTGCDSNHFCMESSGAGLCWPKYGSNTVCTSNGQCLSGKCDTAAGYTRKVCIGGGTGTTYSSCSGPSNTQANCASGNVCLALPGGYFCVPKNPEGGCVSGTTKCQKEGLSSFQYTCNSSGYFDKTRRCDGECNTDGKTCMSFTKCTLGQTRCNSSAKAFEQCVKVADTTNWEGSYCPNGCNSSGCITGPVVPSPTGVHYTCDEHDDKCVSSSSVCTPSTFYQWTCAPGKKCVPDDAVCVNPVCSCVGGKWTGSSCGAEVVGKSCIIPTTVPSCDQTKYKGDKSGNTWLHFDDAYTAKCICGGTDYHYVCASGYWACGDGRKDSNCPKCIEACPNSSQKSLLQSCSPADSDGTSLDNSCDKAGKTGSCGGKTYCCPSAGGAWTTDTAKCGGVCKEKVGGWSLNDFSMWRSEYIDGSFGTTSKTTWQADFDCDGKVTLNDFSIWRTNFIKSL